MLDMLSVVAETITTAFIITPRKLPMIALSNPTNQTIPS